MKKKKLLLFSILVILLAVFSGFTQQYSYDYKSMSMDEYRAELAKWQKRLADAEAAITAEEAKIAELNQQVAQLDDEIAKTKQEMYALMDTDEATYKSYLGDIQSLEGNLNGFAALSPEEMYSKKGELDGYKQSFEQFKADKKSLGPETYAAVGRIEQLFNQIDNKLRSAVVMYEVKRGDYLWRIAKKPDIYGNPYAWIRIYTANRDQIKNPDLIYPRQVFRIPKVPGSDEYWVERGEFLYKIAGYSSVYGNPFQWQKIYEANKDVISDPNLIYPFMILKIPRN